MTADDKNSFVKAYLDDIGNRLDRLYKIATQGFTEETLILACCYLNGVAQARFDRNHEDTKLFTELLRRYGDRPEIFERVSRIELIKRTDKDPFAPKALQEHANISAEVIKRFGDDAAVTNDPTEDQLLRVLSGMPRVDASCWTEPDPGGG